MGAYRRRPPRQLHRALLRRGVESILADHARTPVSDRLAGRSLHRNRARPSRPGHAAKPENRKSATRDLAFYMTAIARLGGYLDRASDAPPGTTIIWRGFIRLADLVEGFQIANLRPQPTCG